MEHRKDGLLYRRATLDDYHGVVDINKNWYAGLDYLPDMYPRLLKQQECRAYLAETDHEIVAFMGLHIIRNGSHVVGFGGRVKKEFQGHGISNTLTDFSIFSFIKEFPKVKLYSSIMEYSAVKRRLTGGYSDPARHLRRLTEYQSSTCFGEPLTKDHIVTETEHDVTSVRDLFTKGGDMPRFYLGTSSNGLFSYGMPLLTGVLNWDTIFRVSQLYPTFVTLNNDDECVSLSTSVYHHSAKGWVFIHFFHGDMQSYVSHLALHMSDMIKRVRSEDHRLIRRLLVPSLVEQDMFVQRLTEMGLRPHLTVEWVEVEQPLSYVSSML